MRCPLLCVLASMKICTRRGSCGSMKQDVHAGGFWGLGSTLLKLGLSMPLGRADSFGWTANDISYPCTWTGKALGKHRS